MGISISSTKREVVNVEVVNNDDWISKLSNALLLEILSKLSTKEVIMTSVLSKRWVNVWKKTSQLCLDMRTIAKTTTLLPDVSHQSARSVTKVLKDHCGRLERCKIYQDSHQCENEMLEFWIQTLVNAKHIKDLTLENFSLHWRPTVTLDMPPRSFSHPSLTSLSLGQYHLEAPHAFYDCWNLKNLKLIGVSADYKLFNEVLAYCTCLEVLSLEISGTYKGGILKIENQNLKFLYISCDRIQCIEVSSPSLDILSIGPLTYETENVVIASSRLHFNRNYWATGKKIPHTSYYISCPQQGETSIGHEIMTNRSNVCMKMFAAILKQVLAAWPGDLLFESKNWLYYY